MKKTFAVQTKLLGRSLFIWMTVSLGTALIFMIFVRAVATGFDYEETFRHMSLAVFLLLLLVVLPLVAALVAWLSALWMKGNVIVIEDDIMSGKNTMGLRKTFSLSEIAKVDPYSNNGISGMVVKSSTRGGIFISKYVEQYDDLIRLLEAKAAENSRDSMRSA